MSFKGKTVIVTGSCGGLGLEIADMFLRREANVLMCDINESRVESARSKYTEQYPSSAHVVEVDVANEEAVQSMVATAVRRFGTLDIVVNNAGVMDQFDPAGSCSKETWDRVIACNLTGPFLVTKHAVKAMQKNTPSRGLIINIGSNASLHGLSGGVAYTASKHGLIALTKNTAGSYSSKNIYCLALLLGGMETTNLTDAFQDGLNKDGMARMQETQPGYRSIKTDDVIRMIAFLSDDGGRAANGSCIPLNGNWPEA